VTDATLAFLSLDELLRGAAGAHHGHPRVDTAAILLMDPKRELVLRAAKGLEEAVELGFRLPLGQGFAGRVAAERQPIMIEHASDADVLDPALLSVKRIRSLLGVPLIRVGRRGHLSAVGLSRDQVRMIGCVVSKPAPWSLMCRTSPE
jgi:GAF domain-containing protein